MTDSTSTTGGMSPGAPEALAGDSEMARLFAAEREAPPPNALPRERVWRRVGATVGLAALPADSSSSVLRAQWLKLGGAGLVVSAGVLAVLLLKTPATPAAAPQAPAHSLVAPPRVQEPSPTTAPTAPTVTTAPVALREPPATVVASPAAADSAPPLPAELHRRPSVQRATEDPAAERALLEAARQGLAAGDWQRALDQANAHERRFPHGQLVEERESLAIRALAAGHRDAAARARAARFARRFPSSIFLPAVTSVLR